MPNWRNDLLTVYHGTESSSIPITFSGQIASLPGFKIDVSKGQRFTDFGKGFYATTSLHQARQWANAKTRRMLRRGVTQFAVVIQVQIDLTALSKLESLVFVRGTPEFWSLVGDCRKGFTPHQRIPANTNPAQTNPTQTNSTQSSVPRNTAYDVVYGPVTLWPQLLLLQDTDQISFHTPEAENILTNPTLTKVTVADHAPPPKLFF